MAGSWRIPPLAGALLTDWGETEGETGINFTPQIVFYSYL